MQEALDQERALRVEHAQKAHAETAALRAENRAEGARFRLQQSECADAEAKAVELREALYHANYEKQAAAFAVQLAEDRERVADHLWESSGELRGAYGSFFPLRFYHPTIQRVASQSPVTVRHRRLPRSFSG